MSLLPEERRLLSGLGPRRARELAAGRACARLALERLERTPGPLLAEPGGAPRWPPGVVGALSHTGSYACAAAADSRIAAGLGVDAERLGRLSRRGWRRVLTGWEEGRLVTLPAARGHELATLAFCAKEAAYKAVSSAFGVRIRFRHAAVRALPGKGRFTLLWSRDAPAEVRRLSGLQGRYRLAGGLVLAGILLPC